MTKTKISVYSARRPELIGSWTKDAVEKEIREKDPYPPAEGEWIERALSKALAKEPGLEPGHVAALLAWSASGSPSGAVTFTCPSDGAPISVIMT